jgi:hypothetical protein
MSELESLKLLPLRKRDSAKLQPQKRLVLLKMRMARQLDEAQKLRARTASVFKLKIRIHPLFDLLLRSKEDSRGDEDYETHLLKEKHSLETNDKRLNV